MGLTDFLSMCYRCTRPRFPSSAHPARPFSEALLPTPGAFVLGLQLQGGAVPTPEAAGGITQLILGASPVVKGVLLFLILFSIISWAIILYKSLAFSRMEKQSRTFLDVFRRSTKFSEVQAVCKSLADSPLVGMFQAGYAELNLQLRQPSAAAAAVGGSPAG